MIRPDKLIARLLSGAADQSIRFDDLCTILRQLGFGERRGRGSHRIFFRAGVAELLNLQPRADGHAKPYQVRQVRNVIVEYRLTEPLDREGENGA